MLVLQFYWFVLLLFSVINYRSHWRNFSITSPFSLAKLISNWSMACQTHTHTIHQYSWNTADVSVEDPIHTSKKRRRYLSSMVTIVKCMRLCECCECRSRTFFTSKQLFFLLLLILNSIFQLTVVIIYYKFSCAVAIDCHIFPVYCVSSFRSIGVKNIARYFFMYTMVPIEMCEMLFSLYSYFADLFFFSLLCILFIWSFFKCAGL